MSSDSSLARALADLVEGQRAISLWCRALEQAALWEDHRLRKLLDAWLVLARGGQLLKETWQNDGNLVINAFDIGDRSDISPEHATAAAADAERISASSHLRMQEVPARLQRYVKIQVEADLKQIARVSHQGESINQSRDDASGCISSLSKPGGQEARGSQGESINQFRDVAGDIDSTLAQLGGPEARDAQGESINKCLGTTRGVDSMLAKPGSQEARESKRESINQCRDTATGFESLLAKPGSQEARESKGESINQCRDTATDFDSSLAKPGIQEARDAGAESINQCRDTAGGFDSVLAKPEGQEAFDAEGESINQSRDSDGCFDSMVGNPSSQQAHDAKGDSTNQSRDATSGYDSILAKQVTPEACDTMSDRSDKDEVTDASGSQSRFTEMPARLLKYTKARIQVDAMSTAVTPRAPREAEPPALPKSPVVPPKTPKSPRQVAKEEYEAKMEVQKAQINTLLAERARMNAELQRQAELSEKFAEHFAQEEEAREHAAAKREADARRSSSRSAEELVEPNQVKLQTTQPDPPMKQNDHGIDEQVADAVHVHKPMAAQEEVLLAAPRAKPFSVSSSNVDDILTRLENNSRAQIEVAVSPRSLRQRDELQMFPASISFGSLEIPHGTSRIAEKCEREESAASMLENNEDKPASELKPVGLSSPNLAESSMNLKVVNSQEPNSNANSLHSEFLVRNLTENHEPPGHPSPVICSHGSDITILESSHRDRMHDYPNEGHATSNFKGPEQAATLISESGADKSERGPTSNSFEYEHRNGRRNSKPEEASTWKQEDADKLPDMNAVWPPGQAECISHADLQIGPTPASVEYEHRDGKSNSKLEDTSAGRHEDADILPDMNAVQPPDRGDCSLHVEPECAPTSKSVEHEHRDARRKFKPEEASAGKQEDAEKQLDMNAVRPPGGGECHMPVDRPDSQQQVSSTSAHVKNTGNVQSHEPQGLNRTRAATNDLGCLAHPGTKEWLYSLRSRSLAIQEPNDHLDSYSKDLAGGTNCTERAGHTRNNLVDRDLERLQDEDSIVLEMRRTLLKKPEPQPKAVREDATENPRDVATGVGDTACPPPTYVSQNSALLKGSEPPQANYRRCSMYKHILGNSSEGAGETYVDMQKQTNLASSTPQDSLRFNKEETQHQHYNQSFQHGICHGGAAQSLQNLTSGTPAKQHLPPHCLNQQSLTLNGLQSQHQGGKHSSTQSDLPGNMSEDLEDLAWRELQSFLACEAAPDTEMRRPSNEQRVPSSNADTSPHNWEAYVETIVRKGLTQGHAAAQKLQSLMHMLNGSHEPVRKVAEDSPQKSGGKSMSFEWSKLNVANSRASTGGHGTCESHISWLNEFVTPFGVEEASNEVASSCRRHMLDDSSDSETEWPSTLAYPLTQASTDVGDGSEKEIDAVCDDVPAVGGLSAAVCDHSPKTWEEDSKSAQLLRLADLLSRSHSRSLQMHYWDMWRASFLQVVPRLLSHDVPALVSENPTPPVHDQVRTTAQLASDCQARQTSTVNKINSNHGKLSALGKAATQVDNDKRLPEIFARRDENSDGQVSTCEWPKVCTDSEDTADQSSLPQRVLREDGTRDEFEPIFQDSASLDESVANVIAQGAPGLSGTSPRGSADQSGVAEVLEWQPHDILLLADTTSWDENHSGPPEDGKSHGVSDVEHPSHFHGGLAPKGPMSLDEAAVHIGAHESSVISDAHPTDDVCHSGVDELAGVHSQGIHAHDVSISVEKRSDDDNVRQNPGLPSEPPGDRAGLAGLAAFGELPQVRPHDFLVDSTSLNEDRGPETFRKASGLFGDSFRGGADHQAIEASPPLPAHRSSASKATLRLEEDWDHVKAGKTSSVSGDSLGNSPAHSTMQLAPNLRSCFDTFDSEVTSGEGTQATVEELSHLHNQAVDIHEGPRLVDAPCASGCVRYLPSSFSNMCAENVRTESEEATPQLQSRSHGRQHFEQQLQQLRIRRSSERISESCIAYQPSKSKEVDAANRCFSKPYSNLSLLAWVILPWALLTYGQRRLLFRVVNGFNLGRLVTWMLAWTVWHLWKINATHGDVASCAGEYAFSVAMLSKHMYMMLQNSPLQGPLAIGAICVHRAALKRLARRCRLQWEAGLWHYDATTRLGPCSIFLLHVAVRAWAGHAVATKVLKRCGSRLANLRLAYARSEPRSGCEAFLVRAICLTWRAHTFASLMQLQVSVCRQELRKTWAKIVAARRCMAAHHDVFILNRCLNAWYSLHFAGDCGDITQGSHLPEMALGTSSEPLSPHCRTLHQRKVEILGQHLQRKMSIHTLSSAFFGWWSMVTGMTHGLVPDVPHTGAANLLGKQHGPHSPVRSRVWRVTLVLQQWALHIKRKSFAAENCHHSAALHSLLDWRDLCSSFFAWRTGAVGCRGSSRVSQDVRSPFLSIGLGISHAGLASCSHSSQFLDIKQTGSFMCNPLPKACAKSGPVSPFCRYELVVLRIVVRSWFCACCQASGQRRKSSRNFSGDLASALRQRVSIAGACRVRAVAVWMLWAAHIASCSTGLELEMVRSELQRLWSSLAASKRRLIRQSELRLLRNSMTQWRSHLEN